MGEFFAPVLVADPDISDIKTLKRGEGSCYIILGISGGDCSIDTIVKNNKFSKIYYIDTEVRHFLFIFIEYTTVIYGE